MAVAAAALCSRALQASVPLPMGRRTLRCCGHRELLLAAASAAVATTTWAAAAPAALGPPSGWRAAPRRREVATLGLGGLAVCTGPWPVGAERSRTEGYEVQRPEREWAAALSPGEYFVLRQGGTERPGSSTLLGEKRSGTFKCVACGAELFSSTDKFDSGTGWPSFSARLPGVEEEDVNPVLMTVLGSELRCARCGGHLGDVFADGLLFPGTPAFKTGRRYCIDGAALVFYPQDGSAPLRGEGPPPAPMELPEWLRPPGRPAL
uniref:MsrB domain-containing protein n=1 Tax=Pyrodinium bahamense TaxID=73915 RepID=A0A7S0AN10_9DINO|mmetsp:Transcript_3800/g.10535  ORF Transcript_3800/g.10535 Transcript_3800/m.10535 type:complete len:264 (+) Transcript_3800:62-853(+)